VNDLATIDPVDALELASDPGAFVVMALERGKTWLAEALAHGDLDALVNAKGYAATLRVAVMQKQLGKDAELSATELVRRAERCIGLGVRQGQEAGAIREQGNRGTRTDPIERVRNGRLEVVQGERPDQKDSMQSPTIWLGNSGQQTHEIYALTDDVTDEQFERVIEEAKDERDLSRANLVRKVKGVKPKPADRHEVHHKAHRIKVERIVEETIAALDGLAAGLALIDDIKSVDADKRLEWLEAMRHPLEAINRFKRELSN
jgi:hypothetical protein